MNNLPLARHQDVVVQELDKEILVYDLLTHKAYHLNETASLVYRACDGKTAFGELRAKTKFTDEIIFLALDELKKDNLIEVNNSYASPFAGMSRREVIRRVGLVSMIALPVISSLVAPTAAMAQSGAVCTPGGSLGDAGLGGGCACPSSTGVGNTCGTGSGGVNCKTGCTCRATSCVPLAGCSGTCE